MTGWTECLELGPERKPALMMGLSDEEHTHISSCLMGLNARMQSDNENDVELLFAGSRQPHNSAPIRLRIYRCLMF